MVFTIRLRGVIAMKRLLFLMFLLPVLPALAATASPFDGTWVWDVANTQLPDRPDVYVLDQGMYVCKSCVPEITAKADGADHPVTGHAYSDSIAVSIVDPHTLKAVYKKGGKVTGIDLLTVSDDSKTLKDDYEDHSESAPFNFHTQAKRVGAGPAGAHALSGSWQTTKITSVSENATTSTLKVTDAGVNSHDMNGTGYEAKFDGKDYPMTGDIGHTMVSVRRVDERTFEETDKHDGKIDNVFRMSVAPDGKTAQYTVEDRRHGTTTRGTLHKKI